jgi:hypothetical protein
MPYGGYSRDGCLGSAMPHLGPFFQECHPGHYLRRKFLLSDDRMGMIELLSKFPPLSICWPFLTKIFMHPQVPMCSELTKAATRLTIGLASGKIIRTNVPLKHFKNMTQSPEAQVSHSTQPLSVVSIVVVVSERSAKIDPCFGDWEVL